MRNDELVSIHVRIPSWLREELRRIAAKRGERVSVVIREYLRVMAARNEVEA